jgi:16S rRNA (cytosine967-C5)-methyltransferase
MTTNSLTARKAALYALRAIVHHRRPLDEALAQIAGLAALPARDRAFTRLLVMTVLRRLGQIDAVLARALKKPLPASAADARLALRLGVAQLAFLGTPAHAAVGETVALVRAGRFRGLVNAILRGLARSLADPNTPSPLADQDAARLNTPDWLWERLVAAYGERTAHAITQAHLATPPLDLSVREAGQTQDWAARLGADVLPTGSLRLSGAGRIEELPGFAEGAWWVQDAAAALPARLLDVAPGMAVVDLCAAPGGKTAQLAAAGARVIAVDRSPARLARLRDNLSRLGLEAQTVAGDAARWQPEAPAARLLLDAPCSATGTLRRHPDVAYIKSPDDVAALTAVQDRLLAAAATLLAPGGVMVYCACSLLPEEGEARIARFMAQTPGFARRPITPAEVPGLAEAINEHGDLRLLPCHWAARGGLDGFFIARLERCA